VRFSNYFTDLVTLFGKTPDQRNVCTNCRSCGLP